MFVGYDQDVNLFPSAPKTAKDIQTKSSLVEDPVCVQSSSKFSTNPVERLIVSAVGILGLDSVESTKIVDKPFLDVSFANSITLLVMS